MSETDLGEEIHVSGSEHQDEFYTEIQELKVMFHNGIEL